MIIDIFIKTCPKICNIETYTQIKRIKQFFINPQMCQIANNIKVKGRNEGG